MNNWKKKFIIIWTGQLFSILSSSIAQFSFVLWISLKTGSAEVLSFATIAALLPQALLGPKANSCHTLSVKFENLDFVEHTLSHLLSVYLNNHLFFVSNNIYLH